MKSQKQIQLFHNRLQMSRDYLILYETADTF